MLSRTFKISGALTLLGAAFIGLGQRMGDPWLALGIILVVFAGPVFTVSATRHLLRGLLWRVGSRLFVSYVLIGILPLPVLAGLAYGTLLIFTGQLGARRAETALLAREASLAEAVRELATRFRAASSAAERRKVFEAVSEARGKALPALGYAYVAAAAGGDAEGSGPIPPAELLPRPWLATAGPRVVGRLGERRILGALESVGGATLLLYVPVGHELRRRVEEETGIEVQIYRARMSGEDPGSPKKKGVSFSTGGQRSGTHVDVDEDEPPATPPAQGSPPPPAAPGAPDPAPTPEPEPEAKPDPEFELKGPTASPATGSGPFRGRISVWPLTVDRPVVDWENGKVREGEALLLVVHSSPVEEFRALFGGAKLGSGMASTIVVTVLKVLLAVVAGVYLLAGIIAAILVMRIARATKRLSTGFAEIETGNFAHQAPRLRGRDQLATLLDAFNRMAAHLGESVAAQAEREALKHELRVARDLQRRLLPSADFAFPGTEIAVDFRPAAEIGGDFYHFAAEGDRNLVVVIADVSGHGLPTGIVMAAAKASLSALSTTGTPTDEMFATLDREIRIATEPRTFVTLAHARFRLAERLVEVTNAGHLYPYRIEATGAVSTVDNPSSPLGLSIPRAVPFHTVTAKLAPGDLWVLLSDGILEATSPSGEQFGFERLEAVLRQGAGGSAAALKDRLLEAWRAFTGHDEPEDDRTLLVLKIV